MANLEGDPPPTNIAPANHSKETSFDNDMEKFGNGPNIEPEYPKTQQQRASPEAERAVVRKLDWRVCLTSYLFFLGILSSKALYCKGSRVVLGHLGISAVTSKWIAVVPLLDTITVK